MGRGDSERGGGAGAAGDREPTAAAAGPACLATVSTSLPVQRVEGGGAGRPAGGARWLSYVPARPEAVCRPPRLSHGRLCGQMAPPARLRPSVEHWKG